MSRLALIILAMALSFSAFAQDIALQGFQNRFSLVKNDQGKVTALRLKKATTRFTIMPFIEQIKNDLMKEQNSFMALSDADKELEIDEMLNDLGMHDYLTGNGSDEAQKIRESLLNVKNINVEATFNELNKKGFWKEFESKMHEAFMFIDPTIVANLEDPRFFYKRQVTYKVVIWALDQAKKRFSNLPVLNIASFVIVRVHDMMLEQRHFHHNMLLHYFEMIPETELGMTKEEVDRSVSSIYEYRIDAMGYMESTNAANNWLNYGMNKFYMSVRAGNTKIRTWGAPLSNVKFEDVKKLNFAFAEVTEGAARKIYHLHLSNHQFTTKPALAYDYSAPKKVKRNRALLNIAGVALGFIQMPGWLKGNIDSFIKSFYVQQVRMEGALVPFFESTGNTAMINNIYGQRANFYIVQ